MPAKLKANGEVVSTLNNVRLQEIYEKGGKQGHKARMELIRRKVYSADTGAPFPQA